MHFGGFVPQGWRMDLVGIPSTAHWKTMLGVAKRLESGGFESAWVYDHLHTVPEPTQEATHECWTLMAALAVTTDAIRLGQMCTCNSYRLPSYMAKVAATVDVLSGGRLEFAIGAGWYEHEYLAYGYEFPRAGVRIAQLNEAVQIIKAMWTEEEATFEGEHYRVSGAINQPRPLQDPHPPLWVAGGGEKKTLRVVAEHADCSNFGGDVDTFIHKSEVLRGHCEAVGRDFDEIRRTSNLVIMVDADASAVERAARQAGRSVEKFLASSMTVVGSAEEVIDRVAPFQEAGCDCLIAYFPDAAWGDSIEAFAEDVMPAFR